MEKELIKVGFSCQHCQRWEKPTFGSSLFKVGFHAFKILTALKLPGLPEVGFDGCKGRLPKVTSEVESFGLYDGAKGGLPCLTAGRTARTDRKGQIKAFLLPKVQLFQRWASSPLVGFSRSPLAFIRSPLAAKVVFEASRLKKGLFRTARGGLPFLAKGGLFLSLAKVRLRDCQRWAFPTFGQSQASRLPEVGFDGCKGRLPEVTSEVESFGLYDGAKGGLFLSDCQNWQKRPNKGFSSAKGTIIPKVGFESFGGLFSKSFGLVMDAKVGFQSQASRGGLFPVGLSALPEVGFHAFKILTSEVESFGLFDDCQRWASMTAKGRLPKVGIQKASKVGFLALFGLIMPFPWNHTFIYIYIIRYSQLPELRNFEKSDLWPGFSFSPML